jgi:hypothetical protein
MENDAAWFKLVFRTIIPGIPSVEDIQNNFGIIHKQKMEILKSFGKYLTETDIEILEEQFNRREIDIYFSFQNYRLSPLDAREQGDFK